MHEVLPVLDTSQGACLDTLLTGSPGSPASPSFPLGQGVIAVWADAGLGSSRQDTGLHRIPCHRVLTSSSTVLGRRHWSTAAAWADKRLRSHRKDCVRRVRRLEAVFIFLVAIPVLLLPLFLPHPLLIVALLVVQVCVLVRTGACVRMCICMHVCTCINRHPQASMRALCGAAQRAMVTRARHGVV